MKIDKAASRTESRDDLWNPSFIELKQKLWGKGNVSPCSVDFLKGMIKAFVLRPSSSMLDLSAGLGTLMRYVVDEYGCWAQGFEDNQEIAETAQKLAFDLGYGRQAPVTFTDFDLLKIEKKFDCALMREQIFKIMDIGAFIDKVEVALKPKGQILILDYFITAKDQEEKLYAEWQKNEPSTVKLYELDEFIEELKQRNLDVRVKQDITKEYVKSAKICLAQLLKYMQTTKIDPSAKKEVFKEVNKVVRKIMCLQEGMAIYKLYVIKN